MTSTEWSKTSWRRFNALQQPVWPDKKTTTEILEKISKLPALVFAGETRALKQHLAEAARGDAFVLQGGDCSEDFDRCNGPIIHRLLDVILQMSIILSYGCEKKIVKIGRIAGQYAKPRTSDTEIVNGITLPSYRGDMVNSVEPTVAARTPDPKRMLEGYFRSAATLNLVRAFTSGGYAALDHIQAWHRGNFEESILGKKYQDLINGIRKTINFSNAIGLDVNNPQLNFITLYTSHEALLLEYEEAMTRIDTTTGLWYDTSAHMLWIGDRTRHPDGAHVEFMRGVGNPIGVKIGPGFKADEIKKVIEKLNPLNEAGRLSLITRFGAERAESFFPKLISAIKSEGFEVVWICDPMHGNTILNKDAKKTRRFEDILKEIKIFLQAHKAEGTIAGGVHLELTGDEVTECTGGTRNLLEHHLDLNYQTTCDPRLNGEQVVDLAFELADMLNKN
ncbi:MAG: 3-deoxy-7-phosphoheptulonate synthase [Ignavibacteriaceae bacterium]|nr:3-deoxy-7-phosphoheptulonate synthase [Ignavibacteriaceae bacterium]